MEIKDTSELIHLMTSGLVHLDLKIQKVNVRSFKGRAESEAKMCFNNAYRHILYSDGDQEELYVLGYVIVHGVPIEHAWVKDGNQYLDVTLQKNDHEYWSVLELSFLDASKFVLKLKYPPNLYDYNRFIGTRKRPA